MIAMLEVSNFASHESPVGLAMQRMAASITSHEGYMCVWAQVKGGDVVAAGGPVARYSALEMARKFRGRRSISCIWVYVCVAWAAAW